MFPSFTAFQGQSLEKVPVDPQRYFDGISNFLGSLLERATALHGGGG